MLLHFLFAVEVGVVTEFAIEGALNEFLYADDLVQTSETIKGLRNRFLKWKEAFENKCLKVNLGKTTAEVIGGITKDSLSKSKVDMFDVCSLKAKVNSALCAQHGKWIHNKCVRAKIVTSKFLINITCRQCEGNIRGSSTGRKAMR